MTCKQAQQMIQGAVDHQLTVEDQQALKEHIQTCDACTVMYEDMQYLKEALRESMDTLPENFEQTLHIKLKNSKRQFPIWRAVFSTAAAFVILLGGVWLSKSVNIWGDAMTFIGENESDMALSREAKGENYASIAEESELTNGQISDSMNEKMNGPMIVSSYELSLEVNSFDQQCEQIISMLKAVSGYIESSNQWVYDSERSWRKEHLMLRVPSDTATSFFELLKGLGYVQSASTNAEDVTRFYRDQEAIIKNLKLSEQRMQALLIKAEKVDDLLRIEQELQRLRTEIDQVQQVLTQYDHQVSMSSVHLILTEVSTVKSKSPGFWERVHVKWKQWGRIVGKTLQKIAVILIVALPYTLVVICLIWVVWFLIRRRQRKNKPQ